MSHDTMTIEAEICSEEEQPGFGPSNSSRSPEKQSNGDPDPDYRLDYNPPR